MKIVMTGFGTLTKAGELLTQRKYRLIFWVILSFFVLMADYYTGPFIQFPIVYILPIVFITWFNGRRWGLFFAFVLAFVRIFFHFIWFVPWSRLEAVVHVVIRIMVFSLIVLQVDSEVERRVLQKEIKGLKGTLPICSFCKKIRTGNNIWIPLEEYIHEHSEAELSHDCCPDCLREHYGVELPSQK
jgi:hypothetical protein